METRDQSAWLAKNLPTSEEEKEETIFSVSRVVEQDTCTTTMKQCRLNVVGFGSDTLLIVGLQERERILELVDAVAVNDSL